MTGLYLYLNAHLSTDISRLGALALDQVLRHCKDRRMAITDLQITGSGERDAAEYTAVLSLRQMGDADQNALLSHIRGTPEILEAELVEES